MKKIIDWYTKININDLFEIYGNPVQYVIKTGLIGLQEYLKTEDIIPKQDIKTLRYVYNICDHVLYEDDEYIKELWAILLLNSVDKNSDKQMKNIFINILANIDSNSAKLFKELMEKYNKMSLCHDLHGFVDGNLDKDVKGESGYILKSLGLIDLDSEGKFSITPLSRSFYDAVSRKKLPS